MKLIDFFEKYDNHFCEGDDVWKPICEECRKEDKREQGEKG